MWNTDLGSWRDEAAVVMIFDGAAHARLKSCGRVENKTWLVLMGLHKMPADGSFLPFWDQCVELFFFFFPKLKILICDVNCHTRCGIVIKVRHRQCRVCCGEQMDFSSTGLKWHKNTSQYNKGSCGTGWWRWRGKRERRRELHESSVSLKQKGRDVEIRYRRKIRSVIIPVCWCVAVVTVLCQMCATPERLERTKHAFEWTGIAVVCLDVMIIH